MPVIDTYTLFGSWPAGGADLSLERLQEALKGQDVSAAIAHSTNCVFESTPRAISELRKQIAEQPNLVPAAVIDPTLLVKPWEFAADVAAQGFACIRFFPEVHDWPVSGYLPFEKCLEAIAPSGTPISVAITSPGQITALARLPQTANLPVILAHVSEDCISEAAAAVPDKENWYLSTDGLHNLGLIEELVDCIGGERIVFGSTAPRGSIVGSLDYVRMSSLTDDAKQAILHDNAKRLFGGHLGNH